MGRCFEKVNGVIYLFIALSIFSFFSDAFAGSPTAPMQEQSVDKEYIRKHYPEVYNEIFREGEREGLKKAGAKVQPADAGEQAPAEKKQVAAAARKLEPGDWWNLSSLEYDPLPEQFLYHGELQFNYMMTEGNMDSFALGFKARLDIRKYRFTNSLAFTIDKNKIESVYLGSFEKDQKIIEDSLRYDITKKVFANIGIVWETNNLILVDNRIAYYGGFGYRLLNLPRHKLEALLVYGYLNEKYTADVQTLLGFAQRDYSTLFLDQSYIWKISDRVTFNEKFRIIHAVNKTTDYLLDSSGGIMEAGEELRKIITFFAGLDVKITGSFYITNSYQVIYDSMSWPGVKKKDETVTLGVKYSF